MNIKLYRDQLANAHVLTVFFGVMSMLLVVALVANGFFRRETILHVSPALVDKPYWASSTSAAPEYYTMIALSLVPYVANVHPQSVELQHKHFLGYVAPEAAGRISVGLEADREYVVRNNLSRVFYPIQTKFVGDQVTLIGKESRFVAGYLVKSDEPREYRLTLRIRDHQVQVFDLVAGEPSTLPGVKSSDAATDRHG